MWWRILCSQLDSRFRAWYVTVFALFEIKGFFGVYLILHNFKIKIYFVLHSRNSPQF